MSNGKEGPNTPNPMFADPSVTQYTKGAAHDGGYIELSSVNQENIYSQPNTESAYAQPNAESAYQTLPNLSSTYQQNPEIQNQEVTGSQIQVAGSQIEEQEGPIEYQGSERERASYETEDDLGYETEDELAESIVKHRRRPVEYEKVVTQEATESDRMGQGIAVAVLIPSIALATVFPVGTVIGLMGVAVALGMFAKATGKDEKTELVPVEQVIENGGNNVLAGLSQQVSRLADKLEKIEQDPRPSTDMNQSIPSQHQGQGLAR